MYGEEDSLAPLHIRVHSPGPPLRSIDFLPLSRVGRVRLVRIPHIAGQGPRLLRFMTETVSSVRSSSASSPPLPLFWRIVEFEVHAPIQRDGVHCPSLRLERRRHESAVSFRKGSASSVDVIVLVNFHRDNAIQRTSSASRARSRRRPASPCLSSESSRPARPDVPRRSRRARSAGRSRTSGLHLLVLGDSTPYSRLPVLCSGQAGASTSPADAAWRTAAAGGDGPAAGLNARPTFCAACEPWLRGCGGDG